MTRPYERSWHRLELVVDPSDLDSVVEICFDRGTVGVEVVEDESAVVAYFEDGIADSDLEPWEVAVQDVRDRGIVVKSAGTEIVPDRDWNHAWRQFYKPVWPTPDIVIHPLWIGVEMTPKQISVQIEPSMAFGTGGHESTQLCLRALAETDVAGKCCLDVGTGTGILAIVAAKLGAKSVTAVDVDPKAVSCAHDNFQANFGTGSGLVEVTLGSVETVAGSKFGLIFSNLESRFQEPLLPALRKLMDEGATILFSGLLCRESERFASCLSVVGLIVDRRWEENGWLACAAVPRG